jgi:hypothetical protein
MLELSSCGPTRQQTQFMIVRFGVRLKRIAEKMKRRLRLSEENEKEAQGIEQGGGQVLQ